MFRKQNSAARSHPSLLTACQMALAVTLGLSRTCVVSGLVTHYINVHDHRNLRKEAPMLRVGATGTNNNKGGRCIGLTTLPPSCADCLKNLGASNSWIPKDLSRPVMGLLYLFAVVVALLLYNSIFTVITNTEGEGQTDNS
jgi:hypothetical protein